MNFKLATVLVSQDIMILVCYKFCDLIKYQKLRNLDMSQNHGSGKLLWVTVGVQMDLYHLICEYKLIANFNYLFTFYKYLSFYEAFSTIS